VTVLVEAHDVEVQFAGRIVLNVAYHDANGIKLLAAESYVVSQGKIVDQLNIEAHKEEREQYQALLEEELASLRG